MRAKLFHAVHQIGKAAAEAASGYIERVDALRAAMHIGNRMLGLVMMGSPALGLCYVAAGRTHAYFHLKLHLWDVAAAAVILQEAGAAFTSGSGGSWLYSDGSYVASNGAIHGGMLRLLKAAQPDVRNLPERLQ